MEDAFEQCESMNLADHGDSREKELWPAVARALSQYEFFWRSLIVLLTNRIDSKIHAQSPEWIRLRRTIPRIYEQLAMHNYSLLYYAAAARGAVDDDRQRLASGQYPHPERVFFALQACVEHAKQLQTIGRSILNDVGVRWKFPKHPESLYQTIGLYRNAFTHDPILGRAVEHGRELLPPSERLLKNGRPLLWRDTAEIPKAEMVDGVELADQIWNRLAKALQDQWESLAKAFLQAREHQKFIGDLGLASLAPIRRPPAIVSLASPLAASGTFINARSDVS
jgi:hypothetical protein